jgi:hypothetical protein
MLDLNDKRIFKTPRDIPELEETIHRLKKLLYEKYYIDYCGIHLMDRESLYMISRLDQEKWHQYYWQENRIKLCPAIQQLYLLEKNQQIIMFFQTYQPREVYEARGEIIGKITPGFSLLIGDNNTGNKIQFCITFKDGMSIDRLNANILMKLVKDLSNVKNILNPFMQYFSQVGNLNYTTDLKNFVNKKKLLFSLD